MRARRAPGAGARLLAWLALCLAGSAHAGPLVVIDDSGQRVELAQAAQRIVSLSPGITELLFAAGAGSRVVAVSEYSDFPEAARQLPSVARAQGIDLERIAALRPDLIVTWGSGYSAALLAALRRLRCPVYVLETRTLEAIAGALERLAALSGTAAQGAAAAAQFRARRARLEQRYSALAPVRVFYQVWNSPVMTLSGGHLVSEALRSCGARNVFSQLAPLVATVDVESVIAAQPELIVSAEAGGVDRGALASWRRYAQIPAVAQNRFLTLDADRMDRGSPRILEAMQALCEGVDAVRRERP